MHGFLATLHTRDGAGSLWGSETLSWRLTCNVIAEPVTVGHRAYRRNRHLWSRRPYRRCRRPTDMSEVHGRYTRDPCRASLLRSSCHLNGVTDPGDITDRVHLRNHFGSAFRTAESALPGDGDDLPRIGLDLPGSVFAPCLLGCPGTTRYTPSADGTLPRRVAGILPAY
jgi:hypothetical protein